ncbi:MAG: enoyl-CoA hydratase [Bdellovibrionales bacterium RIFOXYD12_FULL_39_22]|nr:MAG: enoyl-CoA hydratase [Bdellovibrionales bacterium RIFOXYB1_FULL_39_21]OFZ42738.1 MAG: enoyl-CoA hydratase [Bdellovibrionales bacterium RIFOXYC12_FULL_39_17]OFZ47297.1 MAG: enoyl-CoA hydratase [Bdellovibrionales bacterium RIFOXYC1_FULL_39_130]OFZ75463.1 MAG: enoyl-CoA hydratase [Bdellovibrionales bacterium RIFOXYD1_FULL_39_84]OFZ93417.1 MAG: enoyl-CoA hydratase [Bdellovibrionales bacterium RIFOXYD12_FULL_39_22]HLE12388.1 enoyl-CoA hydratase-related protein [Bacteriovoracaceae bacterium]
MGAKEKLFLENRDKRGVLTITLNRPDIHNAFNDQLISELTELFESINNGLNTRLVVITGAGKSFCAGADLNWMKSMAKYTQEENYQDSQKLAAMFEAVNNCNCPVIGKINGAALGGGAGLVSVCDYALASEAARFGFTEVRLGLLPAVISPYVIAKIGESNARATFLSGELFSPARAQTMGLIHQVVASSELTAKAEEIIVEFLKAGPSATTNAKKLIKKVKSNKNREEIRDYTCQAISLARISQEGQEGMNSLLNKSQPRWINYEN